MYQQTNKISVIIPVYNVEKYLDKCIQSVVNQTYTNLEIILINDGSTDNSGCICDDWSRQDDRILVIHQKNSGVSKARNVGIEHAEGEYICFVDADDYLEGDGLKNLYSKMKEDTQLVCGGYVDESIYGNVCVNDFDKYDDLYECILHGTGGVPWGKLYRKDIINNHHIRFHEEIYISEDMIFNLEYGRYVQKWYVVQQNVYRYNRVNESSIISSVSYKDAKCYLEFFDLLKNELMQNGYDTNTVIKHIEKRKIALLERILSSVKSREDFFDIFKTNSILWKMLYEVNCQNRLILWAKLNNWRGIISYNFINNILKKMKLILKRYY